MVTFNTNVIARGVVPALFTSRLSPAAERVVGDADKPVNQFALRIVEHPDDVALYAKFGLHAVEFTERNAIEVALPAKGDTVLVVGQADRIAGDLARVGVRVSHSIAHYPYRSMAEALRHEEDRRGVRFSDAELLDLLLRVELEQARELELHELTPSGHPLAIRRLPEPPLEFLAPIQLAAVPRQPELVAGMLQRGGQSLWAGCPKAGKSLIALELVLAVCDGRPFLGRRCEQGRVVYLCAEGGAAGLRDRIAATIGHARMQDATDPIHGNLRVFAGMPRDLCEPAGRRRLLEALAACKPALVVVDTVARAVSSSARDENDTKDMGAFVATLDMVRDSIGAAVVVVHHLGKSGTERGNSALRAAVDSFVTIRRSDAPMTSRLSVEEQRFGEAAEPIDVTFARVVVGETQDGPVVCWRVDSHSSAAAHVENGKADALALALEAAGAAGITFKEATAALSRAKSTTSARLGREVGSGRLEQFTDADGQVRWRRAGSA